MKDPYHDANLYLLLSLSLELLDSQLGKIRKRSRVIDASLAPCTHVANRVRVAPVRKTTPQLFNVSHGA